MTNVSKIWATESEEEREDALAAATQAVGRGELVVLPTDTVYGIGADAFDSTAVAALLAAKGRGRDMPVPVLISAAATVDALVTQVPAYARALAARFWPGPLTLVGQQQRSLMWDLGDTRGTVAVRVPDDDLARELLERTGPLAVSSANSTGQPPASTAAEAEGQLGELVSVYLDGGPSRGDQPSTILDVTGDRPRLLRLGALSVPELNEVLEPLDASLAEEQ